MDVFARRGFVIHDVDPKLELDLAPAASSDERLFFRDAGAGDASTKAAAPGVRFEMPVAEAMEVIVQSCIEHLRSNGSVVVERRLGASLHQVRVSTRRLRAALSLFKPALADPKFDNLRLELRWFAGQLGEARNLDVFLTRKGLPKPMRDAVKAEREIAYDHVIAALQSDRLQLLLIDLIAWTEFGCWRQNAKAARPLPDFTARRLYKWWQRLAHHGDLDAMRARERHELRIEIKKLRYALDFVQPLHAGAGRKQRQFYKSVERLQESLGKLNDLVTARSLWRRFGQKLPRSKNREREVEEKCLRSAQASFDRLRKIGPYWTRLT